MKNTEKYEELGDVIHMHFGLSYANYLVLPRVSLQSMPPEWQQKFIDLLNELEETVDVQDKDVYGYWVRAKGLGGRFVSDPLNDYDRGRRKLTTKK